jgi:alkaline phosphatase D
MRLHFPSAALAALALAACASRDAETALDVSPDGPAGAIRARPMLSAPLDEAKAFKRIVFASCAQQNEDQAIWDRIAGERPDLVLYIGDNVYGDVRSGDRSLPELKAAYMRLADSAPFARARAAAPFLTVWDDHDYGANDAGAEFPLKEQSEDLFEHVWAVGADDPRAAREGVYGAWMIGPEGARVQVILLDARFFRSALTPTDAPNARGKERWLPDADPAKTMLGAAQWTWLKEELQKPADLRLLVSSIQVLSEGHGFEAWRLLPAERERLYRVLAERNAGALVILSGDRHAGALYAKKVATGETILEATSSSLNLPASKWRAQSGETWTEPDPGRIGPMFYDANYGRIDIDWTNRGASVSIRAADGSEVFSRSVALAPGGRE